MEESAAKANRGGALKPYRVLDLTEGGYLLCGSILSDLGADVIKIEPPGGSPTRNIGPFYRDDPDPEKSLFWFAYNANKRSITLNLESADGQKLFTNLVRKADFVLESFPPRYMADIGLDYPDLNRVNPRIIMTSMTPFGQTGPYRQFKGPDIVIMGMSGRMYVDGSPDRPPVRISFPQAELNAALDGAIGSLLAHYYREMTGIGQYVDAAAEPAVSYSIPDVRRYWDLSHIIVKRAGIYRTIGLTGAVFIQQWRCKDGYVTLWPIGGPYGESMKALTKWMDEEGMSPQFLKELDWDALDFAHITQEQINRVAGPLLAFFGKHTKAELLEGAVKRRITYLPVNTVKDLAESPQLAARDWWLKLAHPELGREITYPGVALRMSETPLVREKRAPEIGEHNDEIYRKELKLAAAEMVMLKQAGVI